MASPGPDALAVAVCAITRTARKRYAWAAWWTGAPTVRPFRKPDAHGGGFATPEQAQADAEAHAARALTLIEPYWARAWHQVMRGHDAPPRPTPRVPKPRPLAATEVLGVPAGASARDVRAAYRARALATHPDHGGDAEAFRAVQRAYAKLRRS